MLPDFTLGRELSGSVSVVSAGGDGQQGGPKMTLLLIWLALSVLVAACVCRVLVSSGPGNPERVIHSGYSEGLSQGWRSLRTN